MTSPAIRCRQLCSAVVVLCLLAGTTAEALAQGVMLPVAGSVHRSFGGATTAAPLDAMGALYWNPATLSGLSTSEMSFSTELLLADLELYSSVPGVGSGGSSAEPGMIPLPAVGWSHKVDESLTFGMGVFAVAGFRTNYQASTTNPILTPQPPLGAGFGQLFSHAEFLQIAPAFSYIVSDRLAIGFGPTITMGKIAAAPAAFAAPDNANGDAFFTYPDGYASRHHWGGGAQIGLVYAINECWQVGASLQSPQWMERFRFFGTDELGRPRVHHLDLELPMIISVGLAHSPTDRLLMALDLRYYDYKNTDFFGDEGFAPNGALRGLGWSSIFALAAGVEYQYSERLDLRAGYTFNQSPIQDGEMSYNIASPLFQEHIAHMGGSFHVGEAVSLNMAYSYIFENTKSGPIILPAGPVRGSSVTGVASAHVFSLGATVRY